MATTVSPGRKRVNVSWKVGATTYQSSMADNSTKGSLFGVMGFTDKGENSEPGAVVISRSTALENGLLIALVAECKTGNRLTYKKIYVPTPKVEETIKGGQGKTIGSATVTKIRSVKHRVYL
jgi:hypothetical protein